MHNTQRQFCYSTPAFRTTSHLKFGHKEVVGDVIHNGNRDEEHLRIDCDVWPLSQQGLDPIKPAYNKPVWHQSWQQGQLLRRTRRFFPSGGQNHRQYSLHRLTEGRQGSVDLSGLNTGTVTTITNPMLNPKQGQLTQMWPSSCHVTHWPSTFRWFPQGSQSRSHRWSVRLGFPSVVELPETKTKKN